jgi:hypothetical protein
MSEEKKKAKAPAPKAEATEATTTESTGPGANRQKGSSWTMEKVAKFARRYSSEAEWKAGHPSSYKSTVAHGWMNECKKFFKPAPSKNNNFKRSA